MTHHIEKPYIYKTLAIMAIAGLCASTSLATTPTLKEYLTDTATQADFYWPFENSFISDLQGTFVDRTKPTAVEINGILDNGCPPPLSSTSPLEYFPILSNHMTRVGGSSALIFGETTGDIAGVNRYLELDDSNFSSIDPLEALGMFHKEEWTLHMVVSPADNDISRGWETLFDIGDPDYFDAPDDQTEPIRTTVEAKRENGQTRFRVRNQAQNSTVSTEVVVLDSDVEVVNERKWYQVIVQYYTDHSHNPTGNGPPQYDGLEHVRIIVNTVDLGGASPSVVSHQSDTLSNQWRVDTTSTARIGSDIEDAFPFHGAIHHFAVWKGLIDTEYNINTQLSILADAFGESSSTANADADSRSQLVIDWDATPRYFIWDIPRKKDLLIPGERDMLNWDDPLWLQPNTFPLVRAYYDLPNSPTKNPPNIFSNLTLPLPLGQAPADIARLTANWIEYIDAGLLTQGKSLSNTNAFALLWQNWGAYAYNGNSAGDCFYTDRNAARAITHNWRDVPGIWRDAATHPTLDPYLLDDDLDMITEIETPFYREGMSQNAFRSKDIFIELANIINDQANPLPMPTRFHFDSEQISNINNVWYSIQDGSNYRAGWWDYITNNDIRTSDIAQWAPASVNSGPGSIHDTLYNISSVYDPTVYWKWASPQNDAWAQDMSRFSRNQYDQAFGYGVGLPALQEINPALRFSEYNMVFAGAQSSGEDYINGKINRGLENSNLNWLDFSSPVVYPTDDLSLVGWRGDNQSPEQAETLFQQWADYIDGYNTVDGTRTGSTSTRVADLIVTDTMPLNGKYAATLADIDHDSRVIYVEMAKYMFNASYLASGGHNGAPTVPWLPYPEETSFKIKQRFDVTGTLSGDGLGDGVIDGTDIYIINLEWQDIARAAVFAYRHGVREFIFWGNTGVDGGASQVPDMTATTVGLHKISQAIDNLRNTTLPCDTTSADFTGVDAGVPNGVVDYLDFLYYSEIYSAGNIEADIAGAGPNGLHPDGVVNALDANYYGVIYITHTCP